MVGAKPLTPKQQRFVSEYLVDLNATQAAIRAGYSSKRADQAGYQLLRNSGVAAAVSAGKAKQLGTAELSAARVLEEMRRIAFVDMRSFFDEGGNLKPIHELTEEQGSALAALEVIIKNAQAGDGHTDMIHKFKVWDKSKTLELLGKHFNLFKDDAHMTGTFELVWGE